MTRHEDIHLTISLTIASIDVQSVIMRPYGQKLACSHEVKTMMIISVHFSYSSFKRNTGWMQTLDGSHAGNCNSWRSRNPTDWPRVSQSQSTSDSFLHFFPPVHCNSFLFTDKQSTKTSFSLFQLFIFILSHSPSQVDSLPPPSPRFPRRRAASELAGIMLMSVALH